MSLKVPMIQRAPSIPLVRNLALPLTRSVSVGSGLVSQVKWGQSYPRFSPYPY